MKDINIAYAIYFLLANPMIDASFVPVRTDLGDLPFVTNSIASFEKFSRLGTGLTAHFTGYQVLTLY